MVCIVEQYVNDNTWNIQFFGKDFRHFSKVLQMLLCDDEMRKEEECVHAPFRLSQFVNYFAGRNLL